MWTTGNEGVGQARYYQLSQWTGPEYQVELPPLETTGGSDPAGYVLQVKKTRQSLFLNYYEKPVPLISDGLKQALGPVCPLAMGKPAALSHMESKWLSTYWLLDLAQYKGTMEEEDALSLQDFEAPLPALFQVKTGIINRVILRMDIADVILRAGFRDFTLREVTLHLGEEGVVK